MRHAPAPFANRLSGGFSLIEILVGMAVALLATLVISTMYANFEGQKRTSTTGADAQENGLVSLVNIERDLRMAGYGLSNSAMAKCTTVYSAYDDGAGGYTSPAPGIPTGPLAPVTIIDGGANSDVIILSFGNSLRGGISTEITNPMPPVAAEHNVENPAGFSTTPPNNLVVAVNETTGKCTVMQITQVQLASKKLQHNHGVAAPYNPSPNYQNANAWPPYVKPNKIYSIGSFTTRRYEVAASNPTLSLFVTQTSTAGAAPVSIVGDIVSIQAQYGVATAAGSQSVDCWTNATGAACGGLNWAMPTAAEIARIKAIRFAVVARSPLSEKPNAAGACDTTTAQPGWMGAAAITLPGAWQCHRYKVFQTVVPLRNVVWAGI